MSTAAFYKYSEPGDVDIKVHVWGAVQYPGLYEIPRGTQLSEIFSLAGGPLLRERSRRSTRILSFKLHRMAGEERQVVYQRTMENEITVEGDDPVLMDDDILSFESVGRQGFSWRDSFPIVSMTATLVLLFERLSSN